MDSDDRKREPTVPEAPRAVQLRMANIWRMRGKLDRAEAGYREVLKGDPGSIEAYIKLSEVLAEQRRWDDVLVWCRRGLARVHNLDQLHKLQITAMIETEGIEGAFSHYRLTRLTTTQPSFESDALLCCMVVRNEGLRLPYLLDYYRSQGVACFFVVDNGSTDGTIELLRNRSDVSLWRSTLSFKAGAFGSAWFELLLRRYGVGHWVLLVDADEELIYPGYREKTVPELCSDLESAGKHALPAILLDMYSAGPIEQTVYRSGKPLTEACPYFDRDFYHERYENGGPYENMTIFFGGMRRRVFGAGAEYLVSKVPLLKYREDTVLNNGQHLVNYPAEEIAVERGALLHFKYLATFVDYTRDEVERKQHFADAVQYRAYAETLDAQEGLSIFDPHHSLRFVSDAQLVELGVMVVGESSGSNASIGAAPAIETVPSAEARPLISVMITVYDRLVHLERALRSVLDQALPSGEMQIEVIQDGGVSQLQRQGVEDLVRQVAGDRVAIHASEKHHGHPGVFNLAVNRAHGRWIHILHDDDSVRPGFYEALRHGIEEQPEAGLAFCRYEVEYPEEDRIWRSQLERETAGPVPDWQSRITEYCRLQFASVLFRRSAVEAIGGFSPAARSAFDWELWQRLAAVNTQAWFEPEVLARVSHGADCETSSLRTTGQQIRDSYRAIEIAQAHLPEDARTELAENARRHYTSYASQLSQQFERNGNKAAALANLRAAFEHAPSSHHRAELAKQLETTSVVDRESRDPNVVNELFRLALLWITAHRFQAAIDCLRQVVEVDPYDTTANSKLAELLKREGDLVGAREHMARAISMLPEQEGRLAPLQELIAASHPHLTRFDETTASVASPAEDQPAGKLDLGCLEVFKGHRGGLRFGLEALAPLHNSRGVRLDPTLERSLVAARSGNAADAFAEEWIGLVHNPPNMPKWFHPAEAPQRLLSGPEWEVAVASCRGLIAFSDHLASWLAERVDVPVESVLLPTPVPEVLFDPNRFDENRNKKIIQVGWWLRQQNAINRLPLREEDIFEYEKIRLVPHFFEYAESYLAVLSHIERRELGLEIDPQFSRATRERFHVGDAEYDALLAENIVFVYLYDASVNNTVIECLARCTPLLVNRLPAVAEYLGEDYPLYYSDFEEAVSLALDRGALIAAHQHLRDSPIRPKLSAEYFLSSIAGSAVYRSLPEVE